MRLTSRNDSKQQYGGRVAKIWRLEESHAEVERAMQRPGMEVIVQVTAMLQGYSKIDHLLVVPRM